jgi:hypothetical protein
MGASEHQIQSSFFELLAIKYKDIYRLAFAVPNGGHRHLGVAIKLKKEGVKSGVPDVFIAYAPKDKKGLWIEFKAHPNKLSEAQLEWMTKLLGQGYEAAVCYSLEEAENVLIHYMGQDDNV